MTNSLFKSCLFASSILLAVGISPGFQETSERDAVIETIENFYIGDHSGSVEHKKLSMHEEGAYRYVDKEGEFKQSKFKFVENDGDKSFQEELLSVEIYENVALARLRLAKIDKPKATAEYKLMTLHKTKAGWRITSICWGFGVTH